jgi:hypothetical protein
MTALLLVPFLLSPALGLLTGHASGQGTSPAAEPGPPYTIQDPAGDVQWSLRGVPLGMPDAPPSEGVDLRYLRILQDDMRRLVFDVGVENLHSSDPSLAAPGQAHRVFLLRFQVDGPGTRYEVLARENFETGDSLVTSKPQTYYSYLCILDANDGCAGRRQVSTAWAVPAENAVRLEVPKLSLLGANCSPCGDTEPSYGVPLPQDIRNGTTISNISLRLENYVSVFDTLDVLPNIGVEAPAYALKVAAGNARIRLGLEERVDKQSNLATARVGHVTSIPLRLENMGGQKRLVSLHLDNDSIQNVDVHLPSVVEVPALGHRIVALQVSLGDSVGPGTTYDINVTGQANGFPDEVAFVTVHALASRLPDSKGGSLHFHAATERPASSPAEEDRLALWLNGFERDPRGQLDDAGHPFRVVPQCCLAITRMTRTYTAEMPFLSGSALDPSGNVTGALQIKSAFSFTADVRILIETKAGTVAQWSGVHSFGPSASPLEFKMPVDPRLAAVGPASGFLEFDLRLDADGFDAWALSQAMGRPRLDTSATHLDLPMLPTAEEAKANLGSRYALHVDGGNLAYVNPGNRTLFQVVALNQDAASDRMLVEAFVKEPGWTAEVRPARVFVLGPGESVTLGVLVGAPKNATEGAQGHARIIVRSESQPEKNSSVDVIVISTRGVALPEGGEQYKADDDTLRRAQAPGASEAPGVGPLLVVVAVGGAAMAAGRLGTLSHGRRGKTARSR